MTNGSVSTVITAGNPSLTGAHDFIAGTTVQFPGDSDFRGVTGFAPHTTYYVSAIGLTSGTFQLAITPDGAPITPGGAGKAVPNLLTTYDCAYNVIDSNWCCGGNNIGISLETSATPNNLMLKNVVSNNRVGKHTAYGILAYCHRSADTYNEIIGNYVEDITGSSIAQGGSAGAGIYVAGMGAVTIANNIIKNCCRLTTNAALAPGGIGINSTDNCSAITIVGNSIYDMAQGNSGGAPIAGIYIAATPVGTTICGNSIGQRQSGGLVAGIFVASGNANLAITGNNINIRPEIAPRTRGILLQTAGSSSKNVAITGNTVLGCSSRGISFEAESSAHGIESFTISGNVVSSDGATTVPLYLEGGYRGSVTGNSCTAGSEAMAVAIRGVRAARYSGNLLHSGSSQTLSATGRCDGSVFDESNFVNGAIHNGATGLNVRQAADGKPSGWTLQPGDVVYNSAGSSPFAWRWTGREWQNVSES
jgi:hypothetical protein